MDASDAGPGAERPFQVMVKPAGPACNLECDYCYYLGTAAMYPQTDDYQMDDDTLEAFVRQYTEASPAPTVTFAWQGGEPTLAGLDFFRRAVRLQERHAPPGTRVENALQTNGTRLTDEWCRFLAAEDFLVGLSLDGPPACHDAHRVDRGGGPTFEAAARGLDLLQAHGVEHNVLCVVGAHNSYRPLDVYRSLVDRGAEWLQFIPLVEPLADGGGADDGAEGEATGDGPACHRGSTGEHAPSGDAPGGAVDPPDHPWPPGHGPRASLPPDDRTVVERARAAPVTDRSVDPVAYGEFLAVVFDEWIREDAGRVSVRVFDQHLRALAGGEPDLCVFRETCGDQVALEHDGTVFACDHYVEPGFDLGNLHETHLGALVESRQQREFGRFKRAGLPPRCRACRFRAACNGGCPKNRLLETLAGEPGLNYLCPGYRHLLRHVEPYIDLVERARDRGEGLTAVRRRVRGLDRRYAAGPG